jgi:hypothetical protein
MMNQAWIWRYVIEQPIGSCPNADIENVRRILEVRLRGYRVRVYLFGSWARGSGSRTSDIDVAVLPLAPLPKGVLSEIRNDLEESHILRTVDLVDLSDTDAVFRENVIRKGILWIG